MPPRSPISREAARDEGPFVPARGAPRADTPPTTEAVDGILEAFGRSLDGRRVVKYRTEALPEAELTSGVPILHPRHELDDVTQPGPGGGYMKPLVAPPADRVGVRAHTRGRR